MQSRTHDNTPMQEAIDQPQRKYTDKKQKKTNKNKKQLLLLLVANNLCTNG